MLRQLHFSLAEKTKHAFIYIVYVVCVYSSTHVREQPQFVFLHR